MGITFDNKLDFSANLTSTYYQKGEYKAQCPYQSTKICNSREKDILNISMSITSQ